jgi:hypothetical protein
VAVEDVQIALLRSVVIQLTGCVMSVRAAASTIARQPNLLLSSDDRKQINDDLDISLSRLDTILNLLEKTREGDARDG